MRVERVGCGGQVSLEFVISILLVLIIFVYCLFIFQQRNDLNSVSFENWGATSTAQRLAQSINAAYLLDDNSSISDTVFWNTAGQAVSLRGNVVVVEHLRGFSDAAIVTKNVFWNVTDINGLVYFKKQNGAVVVSYLG